MLAMRDIIAAQLSGADLVIANKIDVAPDYWNALPAIAELSGGAPCLTVDARGLDAAAFWTEICVRLEGKV